jgi:phage-related protein
MGTAAKGIGKVGLSSMGALAKGVGAVTAASAAGVAAIAIGGVAALSKMASMAKETAESVKDIPTWKLTESQKAWVEYGKQLDTLDASVANAKSALGGVLLPVLSELSAEGSAFLNDFARDMEAAAGDASKQGEVLSNYIVKGATLIKQKLPEYIALGKELISSLGEGLEESGPELLDMALDLCMDLLDMIIQYAPQLAQAGITLVEKLTQSLTDQGPELITAAVDMVTAIVSGLAQAAPSLIPAAGQLVTQLILALISAAPDLLLAGLELVYGIISGLVDGEGDIINTAAQLITSLVASFSAKADDFRNLGKKIIAKIKEGILSGWDALKKWFERLIGSLGGDIEVSPDVTVTPDSVSPNTLDVPGLANSRIYQAAKAGTTKIINLTINTQSLSPAEVDALVDYINRKLGDDM